MMRRDFTVIEREVRDFPEPVVVCFDVHKWFGNYHALRGVTTLIGRGEKVVVVGPSGSGKSTFIRTINRLEEHQRGDIIVDGIRLTNDTRNIDRIRRDVGMVFQQFNLFPHLSVIQNITLAPIKVLKVRREDAEESAMELLTRVGIRDEQAAKFPGELSGGQQQRVAIARALAMRPQNHALRRADLSTGPGDDPRGAGRDAGAGGVGHDDDNCHPRNRFSPARWADRVVMFDEGEIVEDAPPHEFFNNPKHERAQAFLSQILS